MPAGNGLPSLHVQTERKEGIVHEPRIFAIRKAGKRTGDLEEKFHYASVAELRGALDALGVSLPLARSAAALARPLTVHGRTLANRIVVQPMEGADANADGTPGELTFRG